MRQLETEDLKKIQIGILDAVHECCMKHGINYWLDSGTLLGAIRHGGYIPWDDDIDIGMLRPDYERFAEIFNRENKNLRFFRPETDADYVWPHGKVADMTTVMYEPDRYGRKLAVYIDVFPFDDAPADEAGIIKAYRRERFLRALNVAKSQRRDRMPGVLRHIAFAVLHFLTLPFPKDYFVKKMAGEYLSYVNRESKKLMPYTVYNQKAVDRVLLESFTDHEFEGKLYRIPERYDEYLRVYYGDYMQLPPENERVTHHMFEAYMKDGEEVI